jgi:hypothetical protein
VVSSLARAAGERQTLASEAAIRQLPGRIRDLE